MKECLILLVEDDPNDAFFISRALKEIGFRGRLEHVTDTKTARAYVAGAEQYSDRAQFPTPDIVVSDSILPGRGSGIELLEWMRQQNFGGIPFVILSGEVTPEVRARASAAGVQSLLQKGSNLRETTHALREAIKQMPAECRPWLKE